jgi:hypothetical protein
MPARSDQEVRDAGPHHLACDGQRFKSLKRHLMNSYGMTPDEYRAKWSLPSDYPMVAPNYSNARSALAKSLGLGRKPAEKPKGRGRGGCVIRLRLNSAPFLTDTSRWPPQRTCPRPAPTPPRLLPAGAFHRNHGHQQIVDGFSRRCSIKSAARARCAIPSRSGLFFV